MHPIYLTLGNLPFKVRNSLNAKALLGYLPIIETIPDESDLELSSNQLKELYSKIKRTCFQECMKILFTPLLNQYNTGTLINLGNEVKKVVIKLSCIISDLPEASSYCLTYKSYNCNMPCYNCLVPQNELDNIDERFPIRNNTNMRKAILENDDKYHSIFPLENIFWDHS